MNFVAIGMAAYDGRVDYAYDTLPRKISNTLIISSRIHTHAQTLLWVIRLYNSMSCHDQLSVEHEDAHITRRGKHDCQAVDHQHSFIHRQRHDDGFSFTSPPFT